MTSRCPACRSARLRPFLRRHRVPVHQNVLAHSARDARAVTRGELDLRACDDCGLVFNRAFRPELLSYGADYDSDQSESAAFSQHVDGLIERLLADGIRQKRVVEVGCGRGYFIGKLCERGDNVGFGFDPACPEPPAARRGRVTFMREPLTPGLVAGIDAVVCRHVLEHIADPVAFLRGTRSALDNPTHASFHFETPDLRWIVDHGVVCDVFYEHCCYFTHQALTNTFRMAGFRVNRVEAVFGHQYQWLAARVGETSLPLRNDVDGETLSRFRDLEAARTDAWRQRVADLASRGPIAVWGAGAKGVTFVNLVDPDAVMVRCLVDINPRKVGRFAPGTGHPVVAPASLAASRDVRCILLMNPVYHDEVLELVRRLGLDAHLFSAE